MDSLFACFQRQQSRKVLIHRQKICNATTEQAKKVSDYGVPYNILKKYENPDASVEYDAYEDYIDGQVRKLLSKE